MRTPALSFWQDMSTSMRLACRAKNKVRLRKGEQVTLFPALVHYDKEVYPQPERYIHDRFMEDGAAKRQFFLNGKRLTHYWMPFGGGVSMCPGRFFALSEIQMFIAFLLRDYELQLAPGPLPQVDNSRLGLGILPPKGDTTFRYRRRR
eukprot:Colp12_sorted_trinity150504_noHs@13412